MAKKKDTPHATTRVLGNLGTGIDALGVPQELEFMSELEPPTGLKYYDKMRKNDPIVGGLVLHIERIINQLKWDVTGPNENFIKQQLDSIGVDRLLGEVSSAFTFGFYIGELIWKNNNGKVILTDIEPRWQPTIDGITEGIVNQSCASGTYEMPYGKVFHVVPIPQNRSPFGLSPLRSLYKPYYYKISVEASEAVGIDRDLTGLPKLQAPEGFDFTAADSASPNYDTKVKDTIDWATKLVGQVRKDEQQGVVLPYGWEFDIVRGGEAKIETTETINRYNTEMATGILEGFLSLGAFASSNNANVEAHVDNFLNACNGFAHTIANEINRIIKKTCQYNAKTPPTFAFSSATRPNLEKLASFVGRLVKNGAINPTIPLERELLSIANLPYSDKEEDQKPKPQI